MVEKREDSVDSGGEDAETSQQAGANGQVSARNPACDLCREKKVCS